MSGKQLSEETVNSDGEESGREEVGAEFFSNEIGEDFFSKPADSGRGKGVFFSGREDQDNNDDDDDDDDDNGTSFFSEKPAKGSGKDSGKKKASGGKKPVPVVMTFTFGDMIAVTPTGGSRRGQSSKLSGMILCSARRPVQPIAPSQTRNNADTATIVVWVPGQGPKMCILGMIPGEGQEKKAAVCPATDETATRKASLFLAPSERRELKEAECTDFVSMIKRICEICEVRDPSWFVESGRNTVGCHFARENQQAYDEWFNPKNEEEARKLISYMKELGMLGKSYTDEIIEKLVKCMVIPEVTKSAPRPRAAASASAAASSELADDLFIPQNDPPFITVRFSPSALARVFDTTSNGDVTVPMTMAGAPYFTPEQIERFHRHSTTASATKKVSVTFKEYNPSAGIVTILTPDKSSGVSVMVDGRVFTKVRISYASMFSIPSDLEAIRRHVEQLELKTSGKAGDEQAKKTSGSEKEEAPKKPSIEEAVSKKKEEIRKSEEAQKKAQVSEDPQKKEEAPKMHVDAAPRASAFQLNKRPADDHSEDENPAKRHRASTPPRTSDTATIPSAGIPLEINGAFNTKESHSDDKYSMDLFK